tara:strand:- start:173 stop:1789 length:1617 start_codon:yes stop_codon:yes gene_type:complete
MTTTTQQTYRRFLELETTELANDTLELSFSTETPIQRGFGMEVLSHAQDAANLTRLNDSAPVLWAHDPTLQIGVVQRAWIQEGKGRAIIKWGNSQLAQEKRADVESGVIRNVSIGYSIDEMEENDQGQMVATRWTGLEVSLVSVASDPNCGIGRSHDSYTTSKKETMSNFVTAYSGETQTRGEFEEEASQFSIVKAIQAQASGNWSDAGREREIHQELAGQYGQRSANGVLVPNQSWSKRTFVAGTASAGGNLVATDVLADSFVDALRPTSVVMTAGATVLGNLTGNVSIPKRTGSSTAAWFGADDSDALSESVGTFGAIALSPKTVGSYSKYSRLMKLQATPDIENLIRQDMLEKIGTQIDIAAIAGTGSSSQPTGILSASDTTVTALGTNGAAASIDTLITLKKSVSAANADDGSCCYLINSKVESALSQLKDSNGAYFLNPFGGELGAARFAGRRMLVSNNVPSNLSKGSGSNLSAIIYGRFSDVIVATWSGVEIDIDPYTDFAKGSVGVRALTSIDVGVRHGESFGLVKDAVAA